MKKIYRIKIGDQNFWIGIGLQLFRSERMALPCTFDEHLMVMEKIGVEATAYSEEYDSNKHIFASSVSLMGE